jgi:hypothetical protein
VRPVAKAGIVVGGYVAALATASAILAIYVAATSGPDREVYAGMFAFGDSLLFLAAFGVAAVPATGAALFFFRPYAPFWQALSAGALAVATTALAALFYYLAPQAAARVAVFRTWSALAPLRVLSAPLLASFFLLSALLAPNRSFKSALAVAGAIEAAVFVCVAFMWFHPAQ